MQLGKIPRTRLGASKISFIKASFFFPLFSFRNEYYETTCYENTCRISNDSSVKFLPFSSEMKKRKESSLKVLPPFQQIFPISLPRKIKTTDCDPSSVSFLRSRVTKRRKLVGIIMQSDRDRLHPVGIRIRGTRMTESRNRLAFNRLFSPDPLEFVRGSTALPSHTWNLRGWHTLSGGVPCSRCVFTFKSSKLCQGTAACINKSREMRRDTRLAISEMIVPVLLQI